MKKEKITEYLRDKYGTWGWMGQRAHDASGINRILPLDFIISCDYGSDVPLYFREEDVFSVEKKKGVRNDWSNEDLSESLKGSLGREIFDYMKRSRKPVNLLCYRSVKKLENGRSPVSKKLRLYAMPERLKRRFDNKVYLHRNLEKLSLTRIPGMVAKLGDVTFRSLQKDPGLPFVIQFPYGSSGLQTFIIREEKEFNRLKKKHREQVTVIRKYINGFSLNGNGIIVSTENGPKVACVHPSIQITGVPECSNFPSAFCGNDYTSARDLDRKLLEQVENSMGKIGKWMARAGYRGVFGMDFVVKNGTVYPVEINPRFQNSTSLYTSLEGMQESRKAVLFLLHIAEFLQKDDKVMRKYVRDFPFDELMQPFNGCQVILHNHLSKNIVMGDLSPGIYRMRGRKLEFVKRAAVISDIDSKEEVLVSCAVPKPYTPIAPNAPLCKVQMMRGAVGPDKRKLTGECKRIVSKVYQGLDLQESSKVELVEVNEGI